MTTERPREVTEQVLQQVLHEFGRILRNRAGAACLIYGAGGLPRKIYRVLSETSGVEVLYCGSVLPDWLCWLRFIPSCHGLIKVEDASVLEKVVRELCESTMVEVMLVEHEIEDHIVKLVAKRRPLAEITDTALQDHGAVVYKLNPDNPSSSTGMYDWLYFGDAVPIEVKSRFES